MSLKMWLKNGTAYRKDNPLNQATRGDFKPWQNNAVDWNYEFAFYASNSVVKNDVNGT